MAKSVNVSERQGASRRFFAGNAAPLTGGYRPMALTLSQIRSDEVAARRKPSGESFLFTKHSPEGLRPSATK
jgi:hypothetical protein